MKNTVKILFVGLLMLVAAAAINAGDVLFQDGGLNVSQDLRVSTNALYVNSASGLVGIGTTAPTALLSVKGTGLTSQEYFDAIDSGGVAQVVIYSDSGGNAYMQLDDTSGNTDVQLSTGGDTYFTGGNVGIGTTSPLNLLHIQSDIVGQGIMFSHSGNNYRSSIENSFNSVTPSANIMTFKVSDSSTAGQVTAMTLLGTGNVGIGTTSPTRTLHVSGNANITGNLAYGSLTQNSPNLIWTEKAFVTCAKAIDGKWYVEYVDANLNTIREWVDSANTAWQHRECYEKIQTTTYYFSLSLNESSMPKPENLYFDWNDMGVHVRQPVNQTI